jgi:hypothetical protein
MIGNNNAAGARADEVCQRISEARKGRGLGNANAKGKHWKQTAEHSAKIGTAKKGNNYGCGHKLTEEHKAKLAAANSLRWERWRASSAGSTD